MSLLFSILGRLFIVCFGLLAAFLAAAMIMSYGISTGVLAGFIGSENLEAIDETEWGYGFMLLASVGIGLITSFQLATLAILPVILAVAITEMMRWNGMVTHLVLGGVSALFVVFTQLPQATVPSEGTLIVTLAMGFVGGFFYWLIAGRGAGSWQDNLPAFREQNPQGKGREDTGE